MTDTGWHDESNQRARSAGQQKRKALQKWGKAVKMKRRSWAVGPLLSFTFSHRTAAPLSKKVRRDQLQEWGRDKNRPKGMSQIEGNTEEKEREGGGGESWEKEDWEERGGVCGKEDLSEELVFIMQTVELLEKEKEGDYGLKEGKQSRRHSVRVREHERIEEPAGGLEVKKDKQVCSWSQWRREERIKDVLAACKWLQTWRDRRAENKSLQRQRAWKEVRGTEEHVLYHSKLKTSSSEQWHLTLHCEFLQLFLSQFSLFCFHVKNGDNGEF